MQKDTERIVITIILNNQDLKPIHDHHGRAHIQDLMMSKKSDLTIPEIITIITKMRGMEDILTRITVSADY
jgi:hypothetical protein